MDVVAYRIRVSLIGIENLNRRAGSKRINRSPLRSPITPSQARWSSSLGRRSHQYAWALNHSADALDSLGITNDPLTSRSGLRRRQSINQGILYAIDWRRSDRCEISNCQVFVAKSDNAFALESNNYYRSLHISELCETYFASSLSKSFFSPYQLAIIFFIFSPFSYTRLFSWSYIFAYLRLFIS